MVNTAYLSCASLLSLRYLSGEAQSALATLMAFRRSSRFFTALVALFCMLFMQLALAAYACPVVDGDQDGATLSASAGMPDQDMPGCHEGKDQVQPSLCHAYGQAGNQSLDKPHIPHVQPFIEAGLALLLIPVEIAYPPVGVRPELTLLARATAPPLSIRNCCFRL